jgi:hypothetical protein
MRCTSKINDMKANELQVRLEEEKAKYTANLTAVVAKKDSEMRHATAALERNAEMLQEEVLRLRDELSEQDKRKHAEQSEVTELRALAEKRRKEVAR